MSVCTSRSLGQFVSFSGRTDPKLLIIYVVVIKVIINDINGLLFDFEHP